jgi:hypothetical protein
MDDPRSFGQWREVAREDHEGESPPYRFITLERV